MKRFYLAGLFLSLSLSFVSCSAPEKSSKKSAVLTHNLKGNIESHEKHPYVILVSIDGFRYDYATLHGAEQVKALAQKGAKAESLIPIYPSLTFPNHFSMVTGLYADHHGLVANSFYDPRTQKSYALYDRKAVEAAEWYAGTPLWNQIQEQGLLTASYFWVGSEAPIGGHFPNYYYLYDQEVDNATRVEQILDWLRLPEQVRPHFITLYFHEVDSAGHQFGPEAAETKKAVANVDKALKTLRQGIKELDLPVHLILVSDHGMLSSDPEKMIFLDKIAGASQLFDRFLIYGKGTQMLLYLKPGQPSASVKQLERVLEKGAKHFEVLRKDERKAYNYDDNPRTGDLVIVPKAPWLVGLRSNPPRGTGGHHGWLAKDTKEMHGIFYAEGPKIKAGAQLASFENIHVYPLVLEILGLESPAGIDGRLETTRAILKE